MALQPHAHVSCMHVRVTVSLTVAWRSRAPCSSATCGPVSPSPPLPSAPPCPASPATSADRAASRTRTVSTAGMRPPVPTPTLGPSSAGPAGLCPRPNAAEVAGSTGETWANSLGVPRDCDAIDSVGLLQVSDAARGAPPPLPPRPPSRW